MPREVDLAAVKPYADHLGDGLVQLSFTLPVPYSLAARKAALELAGKMGFSEPEVVHYEQLTEGYTYFVMYGTCAQTIDFTALEGEGFNIEYMTEEEIERFAAEHVGRRIVVVGASTGSDTHSVGIDAMLNLKLEFKKLDDFGPEGIVKQVPELRTMLELRAALTALKGPLGNIPAFRKKIQSLLGDGEARKKLVEELKLGSS